MQTKRIAAALFALALVAGIGGVAYAASAADAASKADEAKKECCRHADSKEGAHCARHEKGAKKDGVACPHHDAAKSCCAEHAKSGEANGECCCCDEKCDRPAAKPSGSSS
jgi:hypothetical protein